MCDLTLCAEEAVIFDPHFTMGSVPGDGIHSCLQELLGVKRAAYAMLTGQPSTPRRPWSREWSTRFCRAKAARPRLETGRPHHDPAPVTRRMTTQCCAAPGAPQSPTTSMAASAIQMFAHLAKKKGVHSRDHIGSVVDYVRKGKKNNFD